jgi:hypothetical protein
LIAIDSLDFEARLLALDDSQPIALDLEWEDELCLFQFCTLREVLIVRHPDGTGHRALQSFLSSRRFFPKGPWRSPRPT